jgi:hypothetical protein
VEIAKTASVALGADRVRGNLGIVGPREAILERYGDVLGYALAPDSSLDCNLLPESHNRRPLPEQPERRRRNDTVIVRKRAYPLLQSWRRRR